MIEKEKLRKEIVEILVDYKINSTQIETTEMIADKVIQKALQSRDEDINGLIDEICDDDWYEEHDIYNIDANEVVDLVKEELKSKINGEKNK